MSKICTTFVGVMRQDLKIHEAVEVAKSSGNPVRKLELARELWPDSSDATAKANFCNLENGRSKKINIDAVPVLCKRLGVSADYLFGITESPVPVAEITAKLQNASECIENALSTLKPFVQ